MRICDRSLLLTAAVAALAAACGAAGDESEDGFAVRDSAGIRIVENGRAVEGERWTAMEAARIGRVDGPVERTFNRVFDIEVGPGDGLFVLDWGDRLVKVYDASGEPRRTFGGEGEGPGEFRRPSELALRGDTVVIYDYSLPRLTYFSPTGEVIRTERPALSVRQHGFPATLAPIPDGFLLTTGTGCSVPLREDPRPKWRLFTLGLDGAIRDTVAELVRREFHAIYGESFCTAVEALAGPAHAFALGPDGTIAYGRGDDYTIYQFGAGAFDVDAIERAGAEPAAPADPAGIGLAAVLRPSAIIRRDAARPPVTQAQVDAHRERIVSSRVRDDETGTIDRDRLEAYEAAWDSAAVPERWPAFTRFHWDRRGRLWVARGALPDAEMRVWDIFDAAGRFTASVRLPADLTVYAVGETVWGVVRDELDVQYVMAYTVDPAPVR